MRREGLPATERVERAMPSVPSRAGVEPNEDATPRTDEPERNFGCSKLFFHGRR
jgi:hypothetical protein